MTTIIEFYVSDKKRKKAVKKLETFFPAKKCSVIENGIYDFTEQFCTSNEKNLIIAESIYEDNLQNILFNCEKNDPTIQKIISQVKKNKYNPYNIAFLTPQELNEDMWAKIILRKNTTEDKLNNLPSIDWKPCRICKNILHNFYQLQTRSADEPMTTFYICKQCGKTSRINN